jgi:hypothetical protein
MLSMPRRKKSSAKTVMTQKQIVNINTRSVRRGTSTRAQAPKRIPMVMSQYPTFYPIYNQGNPLTQPMTAVRNMPTVMSPIEQNIPQNFTALPYRLSPMLPDNVETPVKLEFGSNNPRMSYGFQSPSFDESMKMFTPVKAETPLASMSKGGGGEYSLRNSPYEQAETKEQDDMDLYN